MGGAESTPPPPPPPARFRPNNYSFPDGRCRILMLGKTGTGKSATGNMLLGGYHFRESGSIHGETEHFQRGISKFYNTTLEVIDTPGIFHPEKGPEWAEDIIAKGLASLDPGPNVILVTISCLGKFTEEDNKTIDIIKNLMGSNVKDYMIIVFTASEVLDDGIDQNVGFRNKSNPNKKTKIAEVARYANSLYVTFNNKLGYTSEARDKQIDELLKIAQRIVAVNPREHFCNTMSEKITEIVKKYVSEECRKTGKSEKEVKEKMKDEILSNDRHPVLWAIHH